jgi:hypothetical protein
MDPKTKPPNPREREAGAILFTVACALVLLLILAGLGIDLASLYAARTEAQRAADAAALAAAKVFVTSGCTSASGGCVPGGFQETLAVQQAQLTGSQNNVGSQQAQILAGDVTFAYPTPQDPQVTVVVQRSAARGTPQDTGGAMPTFFAKIFGITSADVSASATAEAFNPSGSGLSVGAKCLKPWVLPNCDYNHLVGLSDPNRNPSCPAQSGQYPSYFLDPNNGYQIVRPGPVSSGGVIGQLMTLKPGDPSQANAPGQFYPVFMPPGSTPSVCPSCASSGGGGGATGSGALYRQNIECCNQNIIVCGLNTIQPITGNMVGPTQQGIDCLIHQTNTGGQDTLDPNTMTMTAGSNNPYFSSGAAITSSDSLVTVPVYDGTQLCPGQSCPSVVNVDIIGFMQLFIKAETNPQGTVQAYIVNIAGGCGGGGGGSSGGSGGGSVVSAGGGSPIPVRLIHP